MGFKDATLNEAVEAVTALGGYIAAHTADPGTTGTSEVAGGTYIRQQTTWGASSSGDQVGSQVSLAIPAGTTVTHWAIWSAATTGTFNGGFELDDPEVFAAAGVLKVTPTIDVDNAV